MTRDEAQQVIRECAETDYDGSEPPKDGKTLRRWLASWQINARNGLGDVHQTERLTQAIKVLGEDYALDVYASALEDEHKEEYDLD